MNLKLLFPREKSSRGKERERLNAINVLYKIQNFTMPIMKSAKNCKQWPNEQKKKKKKKKKEEIIELTYESLQTQIENSYAKLKISVNFNSFLGF